jgi:hypothetical protein
MNQQGVHSSRPFLLMEGGPLYRIEKRMGLIKGHAPLLFRRAALSMVVTWLPLLILSAIEGRAAGHAVGMPFLRDFGAYTRFLLALPLLLVAEVILGPRIAEAAEHFITSGVVGERDYQKFDSYIDAALRLRDSVLAEMVILVIAYLVTIFASSATEIHVSTWRANHLAPSVSLTWAGWWLLLVCVPLLQFLVLRWLWRLFLWFQFLNRVSKLNVQLFPTHPDEAGGLGFVGEAQRFFGILLFSYSAGAVGVLANMIVYDKVPLKNFGSAIATYLVVELLIILGPLVIFTGRLVKTKRRGLHQYGALATAYTGSFQRKWIGKENPEHEELLGTGDIQSLADLGNSYGFIEKMGALPLDLRTVLHLTIASLLPMTPLLLTVMPLKDIVHLLFKVLL